MTPLERLESMGVSRDTAWRVLQDLGITGDTLAELGIPQRSSTHKQYQLFTLTLKAGLAQAQAEVFLAEYGDDFRPAGGAL